MEGVLDGGRVCYIMADSEGNMAETITAGEANRNFTRILDEVAGGREYIVTRDGTPVARLTPVAITPRTLTPLQQKALDDLIAFARTHEVPADAEPAKFDREELYMERFRKFDRN